MLGEHLVNRFIAAVSSLWLVEPEVHNAQHAEAAEDETGLATKVGLVRIEELWKNESPHGEERVLEGNADSDGLNSQT